LIAAVGKHHRRDVAIGLVAKPDGLARAKRPAAARARRRRPKNFAKTKSAARPKQRRDRCDRPYWRSTTAMLERSGQRPPAFFESASIAS
jgi:hypothetical protein